MTFLVFVGSLVIAILLFFTIACAFVSLDELSSRYSEAKASLPVLVLLCLAIVVGTIFGFGLCGVTML